MRVISGIFVCVFFLLPVSIYSQHGHHTKENGESKRKSQSLIPQDSSLPKSDAPVTPATQGVATSSANIAPASAVQPSAIQTPTSSPTVAPSVAQTSVAQSAPVGNATASVQPAAAQPATPHTQVPPAAQTQAATEKTQEQKQAAPAEDEVKGLDTADIEDPRGNWLLKRQWFQRAQARYEKIKGLVQNISEMRMEFFKKRAELDRKILDPFYLEYGLGRGLLEELVANLMTRIKDEQSKEGSVNEEERVLLEKLESEKNTLEQLQKDVHTINEIDLRLDDLTSMLIQQIGKARGYESQGWQYLKKISDELSDKKAYEDFYVMGTLWENANDISEFIQGPFLQSFDQFIKLANEQVEKVKETIKALKEKGIDFKRQLQSIEDKTQEEKDKERLEQERQAEEEALIRKKKEEEKNRSYLSRVGSMTLGFANHVYGYIKAGFVAVWNMTFGRFFGDTKKEQPEEKPAEENKVAFLLPCPPIPRDTKPS